MSGLEDQAEKIFAGDDPFAIVARWLKEAEASEPADANAMSLATVDAGGLPNARIVLLKEIEGPKPQRPGAFVFYTNYESAKGQELARNPHAGVVIYWKSLDRQIRARGPVEKIEPEKSDAYYASREYQSQIGARASQQSRPLESRGALMDAVAQVSAEYPQAPPRPEHWGGYRLSPIEIELWAAGSFRLHDRFRWTRAGEMWRAQRLHP